MPAILSDDSCRESPNCIVEYAYASHLFESQASVKTKGHHNRAGHSNRPETHGRTLGCVYPCSFLATNRVLRVAAGS